MKRLIYNQLIEWKNRRYRKPLVLLGARQVGKTYILKEFGENEFENFVYINCHKDVYAASLFRDVDASRILPELEHYYNVKVKPGKTLLFFDEIQEVKNGLASMKYFCEMKYEDMSELLGTSVGALKASYHIAVKKICSFIEKED